MTTLDKFTKTAGAELEGAFAEPAGPASVGGVVVVHEWWGISDFIEIVCD